MIQELSLITGVDIPFKSARLILHQPRMKEIAYLGELRFLQGCELIKFSKNSIPDQDKNNLSNYTDFEILMEIFNSKEKEAILQKDIFLDTLQLFFPLYEIKIDKDKIILFDTVEHYIDKTNFDNFKQCINQITNFGANSISTNYNPKGELASKLANKFRKRKEKLAKENKASNQDSIFSLWISILAVGQSKNINDYLDYTIYQLKEEYNRFILKYKYDSYVQRALAGAISKDNHEEIEDWMKNLQKNK